MARQKKPVHRVEMTEGKRNIIRQLLGNMILRQQKIFRMLLKISWVVPLRK